MTDVSLEVLKFMFEVIFFIYIFHMFPKLLNRWFNLLQLISSPLSLLKNSVFLSQSRWSKVRGLFFSFCCHPHLWLISPWRPRYTFMLTAELFCLFLCLLRGKARFFHVQTRIIMANLNTRKERCSQSFLCAAVDKGLLCLLKTTAYATYPAYGA